LRFDGLNTRLEDVCCLARNAPNRRFHDVTIHRLSSVKLPAALVQQAREAAQPLRRIVEHSGLTARETQVAIKGWRRLFSICWLAPTVLASPPCFVPLLRKA